MCSPQGSKGMLQIWVNIFYWETIGLAQEPPRLTQSPWLHMSEVLCFMLDFFLPAFSFLLLYLREADEGDPEDVPHPSSWPPIHRGTNYRGEELLGKAFDWGWIRRAARWLCAWQRGEQACTAVRIP